MSEITEFLGTREEWCLVALAEMSPFLADRGIEVTPEPYIEYIKRPPHDKYL